MAKPRLGIGVIGMGWMGEVHSRAYRLVPERFPDVPAIPELVACSDALPQRAATMAGRHGFTHSHTDWHQLIEDPAIDIVDITTPNDLHLEIVQAAAAAGKHINCEKPVGRIPAETAEIARIVREAGVLSFVGFNYRWAPMVLHARNLLHSGRLGAITHYRGRFFSMYGSDPLSPLSWRYQQEHGGYGALNDIMAHVIDMALYLVGPIRRLVSQSHRFITERPPAPAGSSHYAGGDRLSEERLPVTNEDYVGALVEFTNGARGTLEASRTIFGPKNQMAFELNGESGALAWDFERMNELQLFLPEADQTHDGYTRLVGGDRYPHHGNFNPGEGSGLGYEDMKIIEAYQFLKAVANDEPVAPGFSEAAAVAEVSAAMVRSWQSDRWQAIQASGAA
ncbi:MAG: Gfo/Idh/MocA family oxidoreductase [Anaerolineaceae bacterium]|nr:Gfo/Idh/MocA family oxidoreductase [Anaerolineaceae bacterium]